MGATHTKEADVEKFEEKIQVEGRNEDEHLAYCDLCCLNPDVRTKYPACFLCFICKGYYCKECYIDHDESHKCINVEIEGREKEAAIDGFLEYLKGESERERKIMEDDVCVCDYVDTKHGFDNGDCNITGLCGTSAGWAVCDFYNSCIKMFSLRTNVLQRYVRFVSTPWDVTEIIEKQISTELDSASSSSSNISGTDVKLKIKSLLAVTIPWERLILIIDLSKNPAEKVRNVKMEKLCWSIEFYNDNIFTACDETPFSRDSPISVYIMSTQGVKLNIINTDIHGDLFWPYLSVLNGNVYMTDPHNHKVYCFDVNGRVVSQTTIEGSWPEGISVDRSNNKVFVCAWDRHKVYELDSDLDTYKSVLDQRTSFMERIWAQCFYRNKLYIGDYGSSRVTVVRLV